MLIIFLKNEEERNERKDVVYDDASFHMYILHLNQTSHCPNKIFKTTYWRSPDLAYSTLVMVIWI